MDDLIIISNLNDFIFCPASIYFHKLYGSEDTIMYQSKAQHLDIEFNIQYLRLTTVKELLII